MSKSRQAVVDLILSWKGKKESDGSHKSIIDIYNSYSGPLPRGIKMQYDWSWCACTWSALAIKLGYTDIMPIEISCGYLIDAAKKMGCWQENDSYLGKPGDGVLYDWGDDGNGDNTGWPDHIGTIVETHEAEGYFIVMEGNYGDEVKARKLSINGRYIRGFITPNYDEDEVKSSEQTTIVKKVVASRRALGFNKKLAGTYRTVANLHLRDNAGFWNKSLCIIPKGTDVRCYGYYTAVSGVKWLYIQVTLNGVQYTGFSSSEYLN